jgi:lipase chaperone LimK
MSLSRRQFFRRLVKPGQKTREEREARYDLMDTHVRTHLLPYDFGLTADQEAELFACVRAALEETNDEELFSAILRFKVEEVVDGKIRPWREASLLNEQAQRLKELRRSAADYASTFLNGQATPAAIEQLKTLCRIQDAKALEAELTRRIQEWIATVDDSELMQYDVVTVKDLVFAQLRSWC